MRRDRTGEPIEPDDRDHECDDGWIERWDAEHPRPCLRCRPWLVERRPPTRDELAVARAGGAQ